MTYKILWLKNFGKLRFSEIMISDNNRVNPSGGLYGNSKTGLLSPPNILKNKKGFVLLP